MQPIALNLDHVGTAVADLDRGRATFEKLGFTLTARSQHRGAVVPGGPTQLFGQANHCAMLKQGYLEILGIIDPSMPIPARAYLDKYEGPHIVAMRPASVERVLELSLNGGPLDSPRELGRKVLFGLAGDEERPVKFTNVQFRADLFAEATFIYTEHLTRETMWQPHLLEHANKAVALNCVYISCAEPQDLAGRLAVAFEIEPQFDEAGCLSFPFKNSSLTVVSPSVWSSLYPGTVSANVSRPVGFTVRTESLDAVTEVLSRNGVPYQHAPNGGVFVAQEYACGNLLHFNEKD